MGEKQKNNEIEVSHYQRQQLPHGNMNVICCYTKTSSNRQLDENNANILLNIFTWTFQMPNQEACGRIDEDTMVVALLVPEIPIK